MTNFKILYTEDDETLAFLTKDNLEQNNYNITHCNDGQIALDTFKNNSFDICILDIMMPKIDGFELATAIRKLNTNIPILFLSAKTLKEDRIKGLKLGADDYLIKPFSIEELLLKIEIFLKRSLKNNFEEKNIYTLGKYQFDSKNYVIFTDDQKIKLTERESQLLKFFLNNKNVVLKREEILKSLWGDDDYFMGRSLDVFISRLRKILAHEEKIFIENLHGIGFRFNI
ncbi:response regulator transcription factor [Flavobacterium psychrophilum]|uniref:Response regulator transcription factor n=1 Tax=Flavobacterium psychrophilum TaxID=96345 RepID=A0A7U2NF77_FLAPS|nr:response regulator transcription factor [Flavobacterium psychrophilum]EKT4499621.1 response regulator transcription factor [Flavobacterium psychrophilum]EKT4510443.1 response regulator transcription factor [Flavobacterium psychrophilum]EKT4552821.1 response regulator transcription factor [Flavobacterium psychrophilum]ELM3643641.1 response regulator transcription factor [Flavobacterium psychrophilum]ELV7524105.1 response regulator transcription factor [Flavobacterium psychrophilum]